MGWDVVDKSIVPSTVRCELCENEFQKITNTHLQRAHPDWTLDRYREKFGEKSLMSDDWRWIMSQIVHEFSEEMVVNASATKREKMTEIASEFTEIELQVTLGGLLGDSWLFQPRKIKPQPRGVGGTYLSMQHKFTQVPYMAWKARLLRRFRPILYQRFGYNQVKGRFDVKHQVDTMSHYLFGDLAREFYPEPKCKKVLPLGLLEKLGPLGLAIWYQDDGYLSRGGVEISTHAFLPSQVELAVKVLSSLFDVDFRVHAYTNRGGDPYSLVSVPKSGSSAFFDIVAPFIHPCMSYKAPGGSTPVIAEVTKRLRLVYGHYLVDYDGPCCRQHGHNGIVEVSVRGPINPDTGMVMDFGDIKAIAQSLLDVWDHNVLNDTDPIFSVVPTAEVACVYLAAALRKYIPNLSRIRFYETDSAYVELEMQDCDAFEDFLQRLAESGEWWRELGSAIKSSPWPVE